MNWPFKKKPEERAESISVTGSAFGGIFANAILSGATSAQSIIETRYSLAFASAQISPESGVAAGISPEMLRMIGAQLARFGEALFAIDVASGRIRFYPAGSWLVAGDSPAPENWIYRLDVFSPSGSETKILPSAGVLHFRMGAEPGSPWRGRGFLEQPQSTEAVLRAIDLYLCSELTSGHGKILPLPTPPKSLTESAKQGKMPDVLELKSEVSTVLQSMRGQTAIARTFGSLTSGNAPDKNKDWNPVVIGPSIGPEYEPLRRSIEWSLLATAGLPPSLFDSRAPGNASREGLRQFLYTGLAPLGKLVQAELREKIDPSIGLSFSATGAADVVGRARALKALVEAGIPLEQARPLAGLEA